MEGAKSFKVGLALAAFVITLALSLGGYHLYQTYAVNRPVENELLKIDGVKEVDINNSKEMLYVTVVLGTVSDLKSSYNAIDQKVQKLAGSNPYKIEIKDRATSDLEDVYDGLELAVYQGMANNSFLWLAEEIEHQVSAADIGYRLQVDERRVYVTLNQDHYSLCRVIERAPEAGSMTQKG